MKKFVLFLSVLFLHGCFGSNTKPQIQTVYERVEVPGPPIPCRITKIDKPADLILNLKNSDDLHYKSKTLLADRELKKAYILKLETAINTCNQSD